MSSKTLRGFWRQVHRRWWTLGSAGVYLLLAVWATQPLASNLLRSVPIGHSPAVGVPWLNMWTIWWNADRLTHGFEGYWTAPIFHDLPDTFAFSEPQFLTLAVAPLLWLTDSRPLAYNVYLLGNLVLNGLFAASFLSQRGIERTLSVIGGGAVLLLPIVHSQQDVLQQIPLWPVIWTWGELLALVHHPSRRTGLKLGLALTCTALACVHQALFLALLLAPLIGIAWVAGLCRALRIFRRPAFSRMLATSTSLAIAICVFAALAGPVLWKIRQVTQRYEVDRRPEVLAQLSAMPGDYTSAWGTELLRWRPESVREGWKLSPGWIKLALAATASLLSLVVRRRRSGWVLWLVAAALLAFVFSLGTNLKWGDWMPWMTLREWVPGATAARNLFRFAYFFQLAIVLLSFQVLHLLLVSVKLTCRHSRVKRIGQAIVFLMATVAALEVTPYRTMLANVPDHRPHMAWMDFVQHETPPGQGILMLPEAPGHLLLDFQATSNAMYLGTFHKVPLLNGYTGIFPPEHYKLQGLILKGFPSQAALTEIERRRGAFVVVLHQFDSMGTYRKLAIPSGELTLEKAFETDGVATVYRLVRQAVVK